MPTCLYLLVGGPEIEKQAAAASCILSPGHFPSSPKGTKAGECRRRVEQSHLITEKKQEQQRGSEKVKSWRLE